MAVRVREVEYVRLACGDCGSRFDLSVRADRDRRRAGREPICRECRFVPIPVVTDDLIAWWAERLTPEEALPLAEGVFGPRDLWKPGEIAIRDAVAGFTGEPNGSTMGL